MFSKDDSTFAKRTQKDALKSLPEGAATNFRVRVIFNLAALTGIISQSAFLEIIILGVRLLRCWKASLWRL